MHVGRVYRNAHGSGFVYDECAHQIWGTADSSWIAGERCNKSTELPVVIVGRRQQDGHNGQEQKDANSGGNPSSTNARPYLPLFSYDSSSFQISSSCFCQSGRFAPVNSTSGIFSVPCP